jgi:hypothetical protein
MTILTSRFAVVMAAAVSIAGVTAGCGSTSGSSSTPQHSKSWQDGYNAAAALQDIGGSSQCYSSIEAAYASGSFNGNVDDAAAGCEQWFADH